MADFIGRGIQQARQSLEDEIMAVRRKNEELEQVQEQNKTNVKQLELRLLNQMEINSQLCEGIVTIESDSKQLSERFRARESELQNQIEGMTSRMRTVLSQVDNMEHQLTAASK